MIKLIKKFFTSPEKIEDSKLEIVVEVPEDTRKELFDQAVREVVKSKLSLTIIRELSYMCYEPERVEQTEAAIKKFGSDRLSLGDLDDLRKEYPKASVIHRSGLYADYRLGYRFDLDRFVSRLLDDVV